MITALEEPEFSYCGIGEEVSFLKEMMDGGGGVGAGGIREDTKVLILLRGGEAGGGLVQKRQGSPSERRK